MPASAAQLSQPSDVGRLEGRKARRGGGFAGLVDEAVEARPWGADEQEPGRRVAHDAEAVRDLPASATRHALWHLARRRQTLTADLTALNTELAAPTRQAAPRSGVGIETAGQLLVTAGDNPDLQQATTSR